MKLAHTLNRPVLVAIPAFFGDDATRACTLVDIEPSGLWLACDDVKDRLGPAIDVPAAWAAPVTAFFPFAQILYIVDPSQFAALARRGPQPVPPRPAAGGPHTEAAHDQAHRDERPKKKDAKSRR